MSSFHTFLHWGSEGNSVEQATLRFGRRTAPVEELSLARLSLACGIAPQARVLVAAVQTRESSTRLELMTLLNPACSGGRT